MNERKKKDDGIRTEKEVEEEEKLWNKNGKFKREREKMMKLERKRKGR